jgi:hypothetical protein
MPSETDIAWAAGLFEGEGFLVRRQVAQRVYLQVGLEMRDFDVISRFVEIMQTNGVLPAKRPNGTSRVTSVLLRQRRNNNPKHSDIYRWTTTGHTAETAYRLLRPHLGRRRQNKGDSIVQEALVVRSELELPKTCPECGTTFRLKPYGRSKIYCSQTCLNRAKIKKPGAREAHAERNRRYKARLKAGAIPGTRPGDNLWR